MTALTNYVCLCAGLLILKTQRQRYHATVRDLPVSQLLLVPSSHFPAAHAVHVSALGVHVTQSASVHAEI